MSTHRAADECAQSSEGAEGPRKPAAQSSRQTMGAEEACGAKAASNSRGGGSLRRKVAGGGVFEEACGAEQRGVKVRRSLRRKAASNRRVELACGAEQLVAEGSRKPAAQSTWT
jgi:hypothetical protein